MPFGTNFTQLADIAPRERPFSPSRNDHSVAPLIAATPSVFVTLGVPIVRGRGFDTRDLDGTQPVAVISELTAKQLFGSTDVVGREFLWRPRAARTLEMTVGTLTVIGIAGDTDTQLRQSRTIGVVYVPLSQHYEPILALVGRTAGDPAEIIQSMRTLAQRADPDLALDRPGTAALTVTGLYVLLGVVSRLAGGLAMLAMVLGMAGLFGVLSHLVARRTREMGVRLALGADPRQILSLVIRDGFQPVVSGLIMGFLIAIAVRMLMLSSSPFSGGDALVFAAAPVPILIAAFLACYWPARRASRVDPNVALRDL
jgi:putative ABC transport system permease protein